MSVIWLVVCFMLPSENTCLAKFSAEQLYEIGPCTVFSNSFVIKITMQKIINN